MKSIQSEFYSIGCHNALVCVEVAKLEALHPTSPSKDDTNVDNVTVKLESTPTHLVKRSLIQNKVIFEINVLVYLLAGFEC